NDVVDPVIRMVEKTGCLERHYRVQECISEKQDWRQCQDEVKDFKKCMNEYEERK
ncbi:hypothetical protein HELRODRAFT_128607, partial [Helobdella robusta]|uniref:CHCH domain-containing protein n=1 Tax=Helobdella robusta TaxID=6412 RepID=T1EHP0_HELRO